MAQVRREHCAVLAFLFFANALTGQARGHTTAEQDPQTGLWSWTWVRTRVSIELKQLLPDQTRAFFLGRGFGRAAADRIARACVFQTIFRNDGSRPVAYDLDDWSVSHRGERLALRTREAWDAQWAQATVAEAARIALWWALLPTEQGFEPGDYNWGMTSFGLPPGAAFDLSLRLSIDGEPVDGRVRSMACAADRTAE